MVLHKLWRDWDLNSWLRSLENRNVQEIQLGLNRIAAVAKQLQLDTPKCPVITVAGTNGKGSTVAALEAIYHCAGYTVGSYTSPHLIQFNERIRVNLNPISDKSLCHCFSVIEEGRGDINLTYFEMATLAALYYFKQQNLDVIILEVGLGGRLDATNIIDCDLAIITTIDFDHQDFLGTTLEAIGFEKAGIIRPGKPIIYADTNPPKSILEVAASKQAPCYLYNQHYSYKEGSDVWALEFADDALQEVPFPQIQLKSASAALVAVQLLKDRLPVTNEIVKTAMRTLFIPGRLQLLPGRVNVLFDVSHNAQSVRLLARTLKDRYANTNIHAVFSALKDKDIYHLIFPLKDCVARWYPAELDNKRAASAQLLLSQFRDAEICTEICYNSPLSAFNQALSQAESGDLIVVYGSFFTVSQVLAAQPKLIELKEI